ncbi:membrane-associated protein, putative, partial [Bodo saltans]
MEARAKWRRFGMIVVVVILITLYTDETMRFSSSGAISTGLQTPLITPPPTITTTATAAPETTAQKPSVPHWQPIDRAVIVYADVVDDAVRFLRELGGAAAVKYVLVFSDDRILSSALHRLSSDRIAATLVLVADCGERLTVQRVVDIVDNESLEMPVSSCERSPRPSVGVARWLSISSGSFLFDAVRVLLSFGFGNDDTSLLLDLHASLVVVNPSEVQVCTRRQFGKFFIYFFLNMFYSTTHEITMVAMPTAVSDSILKTVLQQPTLEHLCQQKRISSVPFQQLIRSSNSSIFVTPSVFGGSRESIRALIAALDEFQTRYPIPPGVEMDFVLATVLNEVREGRSSVQLKVRLVSDDDARVVTNDTCNVVEQCVLGDTTGSSLVSSLPALVLSSRRCMWSKPLQPAPLRQPPTCHSKWFDDYYLLHEGNSNTNRIPSALVSPNSLG